MLQLFYRAHDALDHIRSPAGFSGEGKSRQRGAKESSDESEILDRAFVACERYRSHSDLFGDIRKMRYRARTLFGDGAMEPFDLLEKVISRVLVAAQMLPVYWRQQGHGVYPAGFDKHLEQMYELQSAFWASGANDPLKPDIDAMMAGAESICRPVIEQALNPVKYWWRHRQSGTPNR